MIAFLYKKLKITAKNEKNVYNVIKSVYDNKTAKLEYAYVKKYRDVVIIERQKNNVYFLNTIKTIFLNKFEQFTKWAPRWLNTKKIYNIFSKNRCCV